MARYWPAGVNQTCKIGLWLGRDDERLTVDRLPGTAAYPRPDGSTRLSTLPAGQVGRCRAHFRFTGCACNPSWYYEDWLVHVSYGQTHGRFVHGQPDRNVDHRVHLYGGGPGAAHAATPGLAPLIDKANRTTRPL